MLAETAQGSRLLQSTLQIIVTRQNYGAADPALNARARIGCDADMIHIVCRMVSVLTVERC